MPIRNFYSDIVIVSGLPRSGTSLMMQMLASGGLPVMTDGIRQPDEDNPAGYFELERVKNLKTGDREWLSEAGGKAVKIISSLLEFLPPTYHYKVIFMKRRIGEVLASQRRMLMRRGEPVDAAFEEKLSAIYTKHLNQVQAWLAAQPNIATLMIDYNALLFDPRSYAEQIKTFLGVNLDINAMCAAVRPDLYRNRIL